MKKLDENIREAKFSDFSFKQQQQQSDLFESSMNKNDKFESFVFVCSIWKNEEKQ